MVSDLFPEKLSCTIIFAIYAFKLPRAMFDGFREKSPFSAEKSHCSQSSSIIAFKFFRLFVERKDKKNFLSSESILQPLAFVKIDKMYGYPDAISRIINCHLCIK